MFINMRGCENASIRDAEALGFEPRLNKVKACCTANYAMPQYRQIVGKVICLRSPHDLPGVGRALLEPTNLNYTNNCEECFIRASGGSRTPNLLITNQMPYQFGHRGISKYTT